MHDIDPDRLAQLVDGDIPRDEREREVVALLRDLSGDQPSAPERLREHVRDLGQVPVPTPGPGQRLRMWLAGPAAVPAIAASVALVLGVGVLLNVRGPANVADRSSAESAQPASRAAADSAARVQTDALSALPDAESVPSAAPEAALATDSAAGVAAPATSGGGPIVRSASPSGWPVVPASAVIGSVRDLGAVLETATLGEAADGRTDLEMTILVPSAAAAQARAAIEAVLPISDGWEPSALGRQPVSAIVQRRLRSPESSWRGLGDDPAEITVVVVRTP